MLTLVGTGMNTRVMRLILLTLKVPVTAIDALRHFETG